MEGRPGFVIAPWCESAQCEADIKENGVYMNYEKAIEAKDLPKAVRAAIDKHYPKATLKEIMQETEVNGSEEKLSAYEVVIVTADQRDVELRLSPDGKILEDTGAKKAKEKKACAGKKDKKHRCPPHNPPPRPAVGKVPQGKADKDKWLKTAKGKQWKQWTSDTKDYYNRKARENAKDPCLRALRCKLVPWKKGACCPGQTPHHLIEKNSFDGVGVPYSAKNAPCVCCEGTSWHEGSHAMVHTVQGNLNNKSANKAGKITMSKARKNGAKALRKVFPESGCSQKCIEAQLKNGHKGIKDNQEIGSKPSGYTSDADVAKVEARVEAKLNALKGRTGGASSS